MSSCQHSFKFNVDQDDSPPTIGDTLRAQRRRVIACTGLYAFAAIGVLAPCAALLLIRFSEWVKSLPAGVNPTFARLVADRPEVLVVSCVGGALGIALAVCGLVAWPIVMGRNNSPSKKVVLILGGLPIALGFMGTLMTFASAGKTSVVAAPLMLGATCAFVPLIIGMMAFGLLQLAINLMGQTPQTCTVEELPAKVAKYFDQFEAAAAAANLEPTGNFCFAPRRNRFRRTWIAPNGAYFVDATHLTMGETKICALSVSSATEDGHHFSTTDLGQPKLPRDKGLEHILQLPAAPLSDLIEQHIRVIGDWTERTGSRPLVFEPQDQLSFFEYTIATHMQQDSNELFWIGNPYRDRPLPPLPGRAWQGEECSAC
jgi:hypothetical protein